MNENVFFAVSVGYRPVTAGRIRPRMSMQSKTRATVAAHLFMVSIRTPDANVDTLHVRHAPRRLAMLTRLNTLR